MNCLYINACVRNESRTDRLARKLLSRFSNVDEVVLESLDLKPLDRERLDQRTRLIEEKNYSSSIFSYAKQFREAEYIVIAAPYWDLSFPAILKIYLENIYVTGLVSEYDEQGKPKGLCHAKKLFYVTTAGGPFDSSYSYSYIEDLSLHYFGISSAELIVAQMLDVEGTDVEEVLQSVEKKIEMVDIEPKNYTYILECSDGSLYCGWTNNLEKRVETHNAGLGAKYTKSRRPVKLVYYETFYTKEEAMRREWHMKRMKREDKLKLIHG